MKLDDPLLKTIIEGARINLKNSEMLPPTFFIGGSGEIQIVGAEFGSDEAKEKAAAIVRKVAIGIKADFVAFVSESWTLPEGATKEFMEKKKWSRVSEHPEAYEVVSFMVETRNGDLIGFAKILPGREMGEIDWKEVPVGNMSGRFSGFLGPRGIA